MAQRDQGLIEELSRQTGVRLDMWPVGSPGVPDSVRTEFVSRNVDDFVSTLDETGDWLDVFMRMADLDGAPSESATEDVQVGASKLERRQSPGQRQDEKSARYTISQ